MNQIIVILDINHKPKSLTDTCRSTIDLPFSFLDQTTATITNTCITNTNININIKVNVKYHHHNHQQFPTTQSAKSTKKDNNTSFDMDSALIHLLPNLFPSCIRHQRSNTTSSPPVSPASQQNHQQSPPPPYTLHPPINPTQTTTIPLTISLLGSSSPSFSSSKSRPLLYCLQDHLSLSPETTYQEFVDGLRVRLERLGVTGSQTEKGRSWKVGIVATTAGRSRPAVFGRRVLWGGGGGGSEVDVRRQNWGDVSRSFLEGRLGGLRVVCWRE
jgi:hypothetical protein